MGGNIVVYNVAGKNIPIVHRVVRRHQGPCVLCLDHHNKPTKWNIVKLLSISSPRATTITPTIPSSTRAVGGTLIARRKLLEVWLDTCLL